MHGVTKSNTWIKCIKYISWNLPYTDDSVLYVLEGWAQILIGNG
jgi:hypothetical protein